MILRSLAARSGAFASLEGPLHILTTRTAPRALARLPRQASRPLQRFLSTETESIEASTENSLKQLQSLEAQLNTHLQQPVPSVDPDTHGTSEAVSDNVAEQYYQYKQQCMTAISPLLPQPADMS
jgi:small subunit ribosomal protein S2